MIALRLQHLTVTRHMRPQGSSSQQLTFQLKTIDKGIQKSVFKKYVNLNEYRNTDMNDLSDIYKERLALIFFALATASPESVQQLLQPGLWRSRHPGVPRVQRSVKAILMPSTPYLHCVYSIKSFSTQIIKGVTEPAHSCILRICSSSFSPYLRLSRGQPGEI